MVGSGSGARLERLGGDRQLWGWVGEDGRGWGWGWERAPMALVLALVGTSTLPLPAASLLHRLLSPERFSA